MRVIVAGSTGLAGSAITTAFKNADYETLGLHTGNINLLDPSETIEIVKKYKPRVLIDAAAKVGGIKANTSFPVDFLINNLKIQTNLMEAAHAAGVERFVFLGSSCIYPRDAVQPLKEESLLSGKLEKSNSAYAMAKLVGIELVNSYRKQYGYEWISVLPTNLYGPKDNFNLQTAHVFPALIRKFYEANLNKSQEVTLWGTGNPRREFLHSDDLASAILLISEMYNSEIPINVGTGIDVSIKRLAEVISVTANFTGSISWDESQLDGTPRKVLDIERVSKLGWKPAVEILEGAHSTLNWYREALKRGEVRL
jgi:GDP-L-fucose synthase